MNFFDMYENVKTREKSVVITHSETELKSEIKPKNEPEVETENEPEVETENEPENENESEE